MILVPRREISSHLSLSPQHQLRRVLLNNFLMTQRRRMPPKILFLLWKLPAENLFRSILSLRKNSRSFWSHTLSLRFRKLRLKSCRRTAEMSIIGKFFLFSCHNQNRHLYTQKLKIIL